MHLWVCSHTKLSKRNAPANSFLGLALVQGGLRIGEPGWGMSWKQYPLYHLLFFYRGRFGQVHKCEEKATGLKLAAKIIKTRTAKDKVKGGLTSQCEGQDIPRPRRRAGLTRPQWRAGTTKDKMKGKTYKTNVKGRDYQDQGEDCKRKSLGPKSAHTEALFLPDRMKYKMRSTSWTNWITWISFSSMMPSSPRTAASWSWNSECPCPSPVVPLLGPGSLVTHTGASGRRWLQMGQENGETLSQALSKE